MTTLILTSVLYGGVYQQSWGAPEERKVPKAFAYVVEGVGATVGGIRTVYAVGISTAFVMGHMGYCIEDPFGWGLMTGVGVGATFGTAFGASITGAILNQEGSFWKSLLGSTAGTIMGIGVSMAGGLLISYVAPYPSRLGDWRSPLLLGTLYLSPVVGAVIGYNWGK